MTLIVFMTAANREEAGMIARALVEERLAACCTIAGDVDSIYRWEGTVEEAREVLVIIKTTNGAFPMLERRINELHSYDVPEIIATPVTAGSAAYLRWVEGSVRGDEG
jgi:periplasmic divalent cation tolerance protein